jgi:hypothetical protein
MHASYVAQAIPRIPRMAQGTIVRSSVATHAVEQRGFHSLAVKNRPTSPKGRSVGAGITLVALLADSAITMSPFLPLQVEAIIQARDCDNWRTSLWWFHPRATRQAGGDWVSWCGLRS